MNKYSRKQIVYVSTFLYNIVYINDIDSKTKALCFIQQDTVGEIQRKKVTERGWIKRVNIAKTLQSMRQTCPRTTATCPYPLVRFPFSENFKPTHTNPVNNKLPVPVKPHKRKLRVAWKGPGKMRVGGTNTAKHAPTIPMYHAHVRVPVCKVSILWKLQTNPYLSSETTSWNNRWQCRWNLKNEK